MKRLALIAALMGTCAVSTASLHYEPIVSESEIYRTMHNLPEGPEFKPIPTRLGLCGETATIVMDEYGYQVWCGEYSFMAPSLQENGCYGHTLERRAMLGSKIETWSDINCDGILDLYKTDGVSASYIDYSTVQMIENLGLHAEGDIVENAEIFFEEANKYSILLFDMRTEEARILWNDYKARNSTTEEQK
ncbi:MAG: hypothetical protein PHO02_05640 [Candidatus Nanoarchaeia archaeon]|nr:hypothetical protein [Candidatus Nanoarchaeia archaeon]